MYTPKEKITGIVAHILLGIAWMSLRLVFKWKVQSPRQTHHHICIGQKIYTDYNNHTISGKSNGVLILQEYLDLCISVCPSSIIFRNLILMYSLMAAHLPSKMYHWACLPVHKTILSLLPSFKTACLLQTSKTALTQLKRRWKLLLSTETSLSCTHKK